MSQKTGIFGFPKTFWTANVAELFERSAFYAMFISITLYLSDVVGYGDIEAGIIAGIFSSGLYFLPLFTGLISDKMGFRKAIIMAFALLAVGYFSLAMMNDKIVVNLSLLLIMIGGSFIKPLITATVAKSSDNENRAKAYSIFYMLVNIGSFLGKYFAAPIRIDYGVQYVNFYSAGLCIIALIGVTFLYKNIDSDEDRKTFKEIFVGLGKMLLRGRLLMLMLIVTGFWMIQQQLYATMPKYVLRMVSDYAKPEWIANVNPLIVVIFVSLITAMMKKFKAVTSMSVGMLLMPVSALLMASGHVLSQYTGNSVSVFGVLDLHPITLMMIIGIMFQALAECFISPRYLEYFSFQAPKGEEGLYLGFSHLHSFLSNIMAFGLSGYLLTKFCPDPKLPEIAALTEVEKIARYADAHYIWYIFAVIGLVSAIALYIFSKVVKEEPVQA